uniref:Tetraspanin n=1 Tax=Crassostrea virginica TaxID=6565 RepID=A0A8B8BAV3_CRAVI|nr:CD151 antigen-like [Crassostrea virginica]
MVLTRCGRIVKYVMFSLNFLMFLSGCALLGYGGYIKNNKEPPLFRILTIILDYVHLSFPWLLIMTAIVCILVSFLGCCGALKKIRGMLTMHFLLLVALFIGVIVSGVLSFQYKQTIESAIVLQLESSLNSSYGMDDYVTKTWDTLQSTLHCCGVEGGENSSFSWSYYKTSTTWFLNQRTGPVRYVPDSCCRYPRDLYNLTNCVGLRDRSGRLAPAGGPPVLPTMQNDQLFTQGCWTVLLSLLRNKIWMGMVLITVSSSFMLIGMILSVCLCKRIEEQIYEEDEERFQNYTEIS